MRATFWKCAGCRACTRSGMPELYRLCLGAATEGQIVAIGLTAAAAAAQLQLQLIMNSKAAAAVTASCSCVPQCVAVCSVHMVIVPSIVLIF
eukprot:SAG11_NODE_773_length_7236_cov_4.526412_7_plen_92_part_00